MERHSALLLNVAAQDRSDMGMSRKKVPAKLPWSDYQSSIPLLFSVEVFLFSLLASWLSVPFHNTRKDR